MASRVELKLTPLPELVDSPDIDPNTQRPRTPNTVPTDFPLIQRKNVRKIANTFFTCTEPCKYAGDFRRHRRTYMIPKEVLYMQDRRDVFWVGPEWSRKSEYQHDGAPPSAVLPWPREQAGERVEKHLKNESRDQFLGIEHYRRPPTNLPVKSVTKYGRATGGYYAERFPNKHPYFLSDIDLSQRAPMYHSVDPHPLLYYKIADVIQKDYIAQQKLPTEYQERFLAHNKVPPKHWD